MPGSEPRPLKVRRLRESRPAVEMLKYVQLAQLHLLSHVACAAFSQQLAVLASGPYQFFLLQPSRLTHARADFCLRQFSFFLAQVFSG